MNDTTSATDTPAPGEGDKPPLNCQYCGDRPAAPRHARGTRFFRGRPACLVCRADFESGRRPMPPQYRPGESRCRNGRTDRQHLPSDPDPDWDGVVRAIEDAPCD